MNGRCRVPYSDLDVESFRVFCDYNETVEEMLLCGNYAWVDPSVCSETFPSSRVDRSWYVVDLVCFNKIMKSEQILNTINRIGRRPIGLKELLAFGATYQSEQLKSPIIALDSVYQDRYGDQRIAVLVGYGHVRGLDLGWFKGKSRQYDRFATVISQ